MSSAVHTDGPGTPTPGRPGAICRYSVVTGTLWLGSPWSVLRLLPARLPACVAVMRSAHPGGSFTLASWYTLCTRTRRPLDQAPPVARLGWLGSSAAKTMPHFSPRGHCSQARCTTQSQGSISMLRSARWRSRSGTACCNALLASSSVRGLERIHRQNSRCSSPALN
jgi:hypothetical protein